eukprot:4334145-Amphidinium_carterae.1
MHSTEPWTISLTMPIPFEGGLHLMISTSLELPSQEGTGRWTGVDGPGYAQEHIASRKTLVYLRERKNTGSRQPGALLLDAPEPLRPSC